MLTNDDVVEMFKAMRVSYGAQWKHGNEATAIWRNALRHFDCAQVMKAATDSLVHHVKHPPTLPEFLQLLAPPKPRGNTYVAPPDMPRQVAVANRAMLRALLESGGVDEAQLKTMRGLRDALVEEHAGADVSLEFIDRAIDELTANTRCCDLQLRNQQRDKALETFRVRQGMQSWA